MFCSECGAKCIDEALFCHKCGVRLAMFPSSSQTADAEATTMATTTTTTSTSITSGASSSSGSSSSRPVKTLAGGTGPPIMTFHDFRSRKENCRRSQFKPKAAKKHKSESTVNVKIGLITYRQEHGELKASRGSSTNHTVSVSPSVGVGELLEKAVEKHSRFNRKLSDRVEEYYLLYPDKSRVENLPGTQEEFSLKRYKEELGKPYDRITLYLCKVTDLYTSMTNELIEIGSTVMDDVDKPEIEDIHVHDINFHEIETTEVPEISTASPITTHQTNISKEEGNSSCYSSYISIICDSDEDDSELPNLFSQAVPRNEEWDDKQQQVLEDVLRVHVNVVINSDPGFERNLMNVRRKHCWIDALNKMSKTNFIPERQISVKFADDMGTSEGAVDQGGPTREFLRLAVKEMYDTSGMFGGQDKNLGLVPNSQARSQRHYFMAGKLLAISICNGGVAGNCISKVVFEYLVHGEESALVSPTVDDVPEYEARVAITKLANADAVGFSEALTGVSNFLDQCGYSRRQVIENKEDMVTELCHFFVIDIVRSALDQMRQGLQTLDVLALMRKNPMLMQQAFCATEQPLTASRMNELFTVKMDEPGSNNYPRQELAVMYWRDYLQDCDAGRCSTTLGEVLTFATGNDEIPPLGFIPMPSIRFWEDVRPKANTCDTTLYLPLFPNVNGEVAYEEFKEKMDDGIFNSPSFGLP